jgi:hypothetical protein
MLLLQDYDNSALGLGQALEGINEDQVREPLCDVL